MEKIIESEEFLNCGMQRLSHSLKLFEDQPEIRSGRMPTLIRMAVNQEELIQLQQNKIDRLEQELSKFK